MKRHCMTCKEEFNGETWMKQCLDCYRNFKGKPRIHQLEWRQGVIILSHPDCTREEINEWIKKKYPSKLNWGAVEITGKNQKVWYNSQNDN